MRDCDFPVVVGDADTIRQRRALRLCRTKPDHERAFQWGVGYADCDDCERLCRLKIERYRLAPPLQGYGMLLSPQCFYIACSPVL